MWNRKYNVSFIFDFPIELESLPKNVLMILVFQSICTFVSGHRFFISKLLMHLVHNIKDFSEFRSEKINEILRLKIQTTRRSITDRRSWYPCLRAHLSLGLYCMHLSTIIHNSFTISLLIARDESIPYGNFIFWFRQMISQLYSLPSLSIVVSWIGGRIFSFIW